MLSELFKEMLKVDSNLSFHVCLFVFQPFNFILFSLHRELVLPLALPTPDLRDGRLKGLNLAVNKWKLKTNIMFSKLI